MRKFLKNSFFILGVIFLLYSCSINKYIPEGKRLYTGATLNIDADSAVPQVKKLKENLDQVLRPEPNSKFLGMYLGLYYYYKNQKEHTNFINKWLFKQFGETPVYQSDVDNLEIEDILLNRLENNGFFYSSSSSSFTETDKKASLEYKLQIEAPYTLANYKVDSFTNLFLKKLKSLPNQLLLKKICVSI